MSRTLAHRGPDGDGHVLLGPCGLAHRRLAIIDVSTAGRQPMSYADGRLWLTYNGEVYNYIELRRELEALGFGFRSESDSEVILAAYRAFGKRAFERFNGMWGLAIYDSVERKLLLSRDRMGVKPLYYHKNGQRLLFASEVKALLAAEPRLAILDEEAAARFFLRSTMSYNRRTFFRDIHAVDPGTTIEIAADGSMACSRYWHFVPPAPERLGRNLAVRRAEAAERVREVLVDSVRLRFRSDVPVGTCLSGGLDSSSIVAIAGRRLGKAPETFSVLYDHPEFSETEYVRIMQKELGLSAFETQPNGNDFPEVIERATYFQDGPTVATGIYSQWHVMKIASPRVKVLLDGQGGDELFGGYFSYFQAYMQSLVDRARRGAVHLVPKILRANREIRAISGMDPLGAIRDGQRRLVMGRYVNPGRRRLILAARAAAGEGALREVVRRAKRCLTPPPVAASPGSNWPAPHEVLQPSLRDRIASEATEWQTPTVTGDRFIDEMWDSLVRTSIPGLLHYEDRDSMAFSIEARTPFLDYRLIELAFQQPPELKIDGALTKVVLRDAMRGILPERVRTRRDKKGYPTPFVHWSRDVHRAWLRELLLSGRCLSRGFFDPVTLEGVLTAHLDGHREYSTFVYQLITFELFCRRFIDGSFQPDRPPSHARFDETEVSIPQPQTSCTS